MRRLVEIVATLISVIVAFSAVDSCRGAESRAERLQGELTEVRALLDGQNDAGQPTASGAQEDDRALENGVRAFLRRQAFALDAAADAMEESEPGADGGTQAADGAAHEEARARVRRRLQEATTHAGKWQPVFSELGELSGRVGATVGDDAVEEMADDDLASAVRSLREDIENGVAGITRDVQPRQ